MFPIDVKATHLLSFLIVTFGLSGDNEPNYSFDKPLQSDISSKFEVIVGSNTIATSATTVRTRLNGANGALSVSIAAGTTGSFKDSSNSDTIAVADDYNFQIVTPATSGTIGIRMITHFGRYRTADIFKAHILYGSISIHTNIPTN